MRPSDPFTSENARVRQSPPPTAVQILAALADTATAKLRAVYGPAGKVKWRKYWGQPGEWLAGFYSPMGFHIRGRAGLWDGITFEDVAEECAAATVEAARSRFADDPDPRYPDPMTCKAERQAMQ